MDSLLETAGSWLLIFLIAFVGVFVVSWAGNRWDIPVITYMTKTIGGNS